MKKRIAMGFICFISTALSVPVFAGEPYHYQNDHYIWDNVTQPNQWIREESGEWWFRFGDGTYAQDGWYYMEDHTWYYFDEQGWMQTGWILDGGVWYYLEEDGAMQTGWILNGGVWYYLNESGAMQTGWLFDRGDWYYLNESGAMETGWILDRGTWYYCNASGRMAANSFVGDYYVDMNGAMLTDAWIFPGNRAPYSPVYYVGSDGCCVPGAVYEGAEGQWIKDFAGWWFRYPDGSYPKGDFEKIGGKYYFFDNDGYMVTGLIQDLDTGYWHYFYEDGAMAIDTTAAGYTFDEYGIRR